MIEDDDETIRAAVCSALKYLEVSMFLLLVTDPEFFCGDRNMFHLEK